MKNRMRKEVIYSSLFLILSINIFSQPAKFNKDGVVVFNKPSFKHCAVLMQDTALSGNRFDNWFNISNNQEHTINPKVTLRYSAFVVDSILFFNCEGRLLKLDSSVSFYNYSKDRLQENIAKYIRLYIGYIDTDNRKNVVVQFVTPYEFKKLKHIYSNELFLVAQQKNLRFANIKL